LIRQNIRFTHCRIDDIKYGNFETVVLQAGGFLVDWQKQKQCLIADLSSIQAETELLDLCEQLAWDEETRVVVFAFDGDMKNSYSRLVCRLKQPVIAAIKGNALDSGLELALACDIRIGTESSRLGFPQIREGFIPSCGGTQRLPRLIGPGKAMEMILTGDPIDAGEACRLGLLNRVVHPEALMSTAISMAEDMALKSPLSLSYVKEALYSGMDLTLEQGLQMEMDLYLLLFSTQDRTEGITAFKEKRKPEFKGI
jgi:enoyl-CoA hydratase/carnithine racemase